ncbi:hypothetical protein Tco_0497096 [Tanacetum coccineum]
MSSASTVTYTSVYTDSEPWRFQWVSNEEPEAPEEAPPSPNYVPGPEHPPSPDYVPAPEHPPSPVLQRGTSHNTVRIPSGLTWSGTRSSTLTYTIRHAVAEYVKCSSPILKSIRFLDCVKRSDCNDIVLRHTYKEIFQDRSLPRVLFRYSLFFFLLLYSLNQNQFTKEPVVP